MKIRFLLLILLITNGLYAQKYTFSYKQETYTPIDTTIFEPHLSGSKGLSNAWTSSKVQIPFDFPFLSSEHKEVYFDNTGTILLDRDNLQLLHYLARIEMLNNKYFFKRRSHISYLVDSNANNKYFLLEFYEMALLRDTSITVNFQCTLFESGEIQIRFGKTNLDRELTGDTSFYVGIDTNSFV